MAQRPDAVIVTHNSAADLRRQRESYPAPFEAFGTVVVVDNGSTDESVEIARTLGARVIERPENPGFGAAVNAGFATTDADVLAVLNPDVRVGKPSLLRELVRTLDAERDIGLVAPALRLPDGTLQDSARSFPGPLDLVRRRLSGEQIGAVALDHASDVDWVVGACMVIRREAFEAVGGFDERYRLYFEDVDLCLRMWRRGWRVRLDPRQVVFHDHRGASRTTLLGSAMRRHVSAATRFYLAHPDMRTRAGRGRSPGSVTT